MKQVLLFGGTAEGRELAEFCRSGNISTLVSVVSQYGSWVLEEGPFLQVRCGALDEQQMKELLETEQPHLVLDATHPYAVVVTKLLQRLCGALQIPYVRVLRDHQTCNLENHKDQVILVADSREALLVLEQDQKPILLTTGSKELEVFTKLEGYQKRLYARVLPDSKVVAACEALGIFGKQIIAMQGPFSEAINQAMLRQIQAGWLVTKESGDPGGFAKKVDAALACGVRVVIIGRPVEEQGVSLERAKEHLAAYVTQRKRHLLLIGTGMGGPGQLTLDAVRSLKSCHAVLGAPRMLKDLADLIENRATDEIYQGKEVIAWALAHPQYETIGVLYSGDTGFYSGSRSLLGEMEKQKETEDWQVSVIPGISAVSSLCAKGKTSWEDVYLGSLHGRSMDLEILLKEHRRIFLLLGGEMDLGDLCSRMTNLGYGSARIFAGENLGYPQEQIFCGPAKDLQGCRSESLTSLLIEVKGEEEAHEG